MKFKFLLIFFLSCINSVASFDMNKNMQDAYISIINLDFDNAISKIEIEKKLDNKITLLHENYIDVFKVFVFDQKKYYRQLNLNKSIRLDLLGKIKENTSPYFLYTKAEIHLQSAYCHIKFKNYTKAVFDIVTSYNYLLENKKMYPEFVLNDKCISLIKILLSNVPEDYSWTLDLFFSDFDVHSSILQIENILDNKGASLSGGERRRVEIARALSIEPKFLLLDEPFAGIDPISVIEIQKIIKSLTSSSIGVLITDHNVRETLKVCDESYILSDGKVISFGKSKEIIKDSLVKKVYLGEDFRL